MSSIFLIGTLTIFSFFAYTNSQTIRTCTCAEWEPCHQLMHSAFWPCFDMCEPQLEKLGSNHQMLRACLTDRHNQIVAAEDCIERSWGNMCTNQPGQFTTKRYIETLKMALMNEVRHVFANVHSHINEHLKTAEHFFKCVHKCIDRHAGNCYQRLNCGLQLPDDRSMIQSVKQCAIQNGFDTFGMQRLCQCFMGARMRSLENVCPYIQI